MRSAGCRSAGRNTAFASQTAAPTTRLDRRPVAALASSVAVTGRALGLWLLLPSDYVITRALRASPGDERLLDPERRHHRGHRGHRRARPGTDCCLPTAIRCLRRTGSRSATCGRSPTFRCSPSTIPETVLVIVFRRRQYGTRCDASPVSAACRGGRPFQTRSRPCRPTSQTSNEDVLNDPRVAVYVNDGRHHLQMQREASYDLITLEPPPIVHAGVGALYSREFYALARSRLKPKGYLSQWLPVSQVPAATTLAMIRAFIDVFPQAVLLSGADTEPAADRRERLAHRDRPGAAGRRPVERSRGPGGPAAARSWQRARDRRHVRRLGANACRGDAGMSAAVTDDRPIQEYGVRSLLNFGDGGAGVDRRPEAGRGLVPDVLRRRQARCRSWQGLDTYLALLDLAYRALARRQAPPPTACRRRRGRA